MLRAMASIATLERLPASTLSKLILAQAASANEPSLAIIDVRDDDHIGGHIRGSQHVPSQTLDYKIPELVRKLADKETVVFHCALSQQRGPSAALRYLRERERLLGIGAPQSDSSIGEALKKSAVQSKDKGKEIYADADAEGEWEDVEEEKKEQKVYVLDRGFVGWAQVYGTDERLTESFVPDIWENY